LFREAGIHNWFLYTETRSGGYYPFLKTHKVFKKQDRKNFTFKDISSQDSIIKVSIYTPLD